MTQQNSTPQGSSNVFTQFPPVIPMVLIATVLVAMAQFGSTEKLAAAFAWLIFVAVLLADGVEAFSKVTGRINNPQPVTYNNGTSGGGTF